MWDEIFKIALSNGIFACLFVGLLVYELKDSRARENKYQKTIDCLAEKMNVIEQIQEDVDDIKKVVVFKKDENDEKHNY